jgi:membrane dipeptidase
MFINFSVAYIDQKAGRPFRSYRDDRDREIAEMMRIQKDNPKRFELKRAIQERYRKRLPRVDYKVALRHIDHVRQACGRGPCRHRLGLRRSSPDGPRGPRGRVKYPVLVRGMIEMGYSDADIRKIMGENLLRFMKKVEEVAER